MKKILILFLMIMTGQAAFAQSPTPMQEVEFLGALGGLAYACKLPELTKYEEIVALIIQNRGASPQDALELADVYASAKRRQSRASPRYSCREVRNDFIAQDVFRIKVNPNGTLTTPSGEIIGHGRRNPA